MPLCHCGEAATPRTSKRKGSCGRRFWGCPKPVPCQGARAEFLGWLASEPEEQPRRARSRSRTPPPGAGHSLPLAPAPMPAQASAPAPNAAEEFVPALVPNEGSPMEQRAAALQARLGLHAEALSARRIDRPACAPFTVYGMAGASRNDKGLLDGAWVEIRLIDLEVHLSKRQAPPFTASEAGVVYMLQVPKATLHGKLQERAELSGQSSFIKVGCITQTSWLVRAMALGVSDADLAARAVAHSYVPRLKQPWWRRVFAHAGLGGAGTLAGLLRHVAAARLVLAEDAGVEEQRVGEAMLATPGIVDLRVARWRALDDGAGSFWHFAGLNAPVGLLV